MRAARFFKLGRALGVVVWLVVLVAVVAHGESLPRASTKWRDLLKSAQSVNTADATVAKAALYAVERIAESYAKVMGSPFYIAQVSAEPYFVLDAVQRAFVRNPGDKFLLELVLSNPMAASHQALLTHRLRSSPELGALFARWRTERTQEETRLKNEGKELLSGDQHRSSLLEPMTRRHNDADMLPRYLRAFFMGLDPIQDAKQATLLGEAREVHRVVVRVDPLDGEFDIQFHQRVGEEGQARYGREEDAGHDLLL